jgi:HSF-type DNA-binding
MSTTISCCVILSIRAHNISESTNKPKLRILPRSCNTSKFRRGTMDELATDSSVEQTMPRSSSNTPVELSYQGGNNDSPLMKLVDAALNPNLSATDESTSDSKQLNIEGKSDVVDSTSRDVDEPHSLAEDSKVIQGTIDDLVSRHEKKVTFAEFLMQCLNDEANNDVLRWMPCGTQFTITNHRKFTMERMPQLFKIRNMSSFVRKLTRWGFSRVHEKATGNSDIFKHAYFLREKPELCKKIRCVNRSAMEEAKNLALPMDMRLGTSMLMGNFSESSNRHHDFEHDMSVRMSSPRRSTGQSVPLYPGRTPHTSESRYHTNHTPRVATSYLPPRISPESEREMMERSAFHSQLTPPQVYTPPLIARTMSAAAEYELEQVLLERQRARMYRNEQHNLQAVQHQQHLRSRHLDVSLPAPRIPLDAGSERSMDSFTERRHDNGQNFFASPTDSHAVTAALEKLSREGEYDLDMSPREAMLRAVLHKRQQQRAAQHQRSSLGNGILKHSHPYAELSPPARGPIPGRHPTYFR